MATFCSLCFSSFVVINQSLIHSKHYYGPISCCNQKIPSKLVDEACKHGKYYQTFNDTKINIVIELKVTFIWSHPLSYRLRDKLSQRNITTDICNVDKIIKFEKNVISDDSICQPSFLHVFF